MKGKFFAPQGVAVKLTKEEKIAIVMANLQGSIDLHEKGEATFQDLKGRKVTVRLGMTQDLPVGQGFEKGKLAGVSFAASSDKTEETFTDADGDVHPIRNFTGWWVPAGKETKFSDGKASRQYSIFVGK
jgi:hypothetical protein